MSSDRKDEEETTALQDDLVDYAEGYIDSPCKLTLWYMLGVLTGGITLLLGRWLSGWRLKCTKRRCPLSVCRYVLVHRHSGDTGVEPVERHILSTTSADGEEPTDRTKLLVEGEDVILVFSHRHIRYVYKPEMAKFMPVYGLDYNHTLFDIKQYISSIPVHRREIPRRKLIHGSNRIDVEVRSWLRLLVEEVLSPFYIFQVFAVILWCTERYYYYAGCIFLISVVSIVLTLTDTRRNAVTLRNMILGHSTCQRFVTSEPATGTAQCEEIDADDLLPGDVILVTPQSSVPCDAVIIEGACVVNESMLTGESVPITKTALQLPSSPTSREANTYYSAEGHKAHTLFRGTEVMQTRTQVVRAVVVRTGFSTSKGELVRSILYPRETKFKFYQDGLRFISFMSILALAGFIYTIVVLLRQKVDGSIITTRAFDLITTIVPPALPAAMTVGTMYALSRLRMSQIYCISPPRVNVSGKVKTVCFDKTGTLTEDGLHLWGVQTLSGRHFGEVINHLRDEAGQHFQPDELSLHHALASCHSLALLHDDNDGQVVGDPLDVQLFSETGWLLYEPSHMSPHTPWYVGEAAGQHTFVSPRPLSPAPENSLAPEFRGLAILKEFTFSAGKQRMAVLVGGVTNTKSTHAESSFVYVKGAPERIRELCDPNTLPEEYQAQLRHYAKEGLRVLAIAGRRIAMPWKQAMKLSQSEAEENLQFLGLVIFENRLKPETPGVIAELNDAHIRCVMVTGDNIHTACSVAVSSGMARPVDQVYHASVVPALNPNGHTALNGRDAYTVETQTSHSGSIGTSSFSSRASSLTDFAITNHGNSFRLQLTRAGDHASVDGEDDFDESLQRLMYPEGVHHVRFPRLWREPPVKSWASTHNARARQRPRAVIAITGSEFDKLREHMPEVYKQVIVSATVFARMSPNNKATLMSDLIDLGYCVAFCGDGANDCGALKSAHVGISLSEAEASVAAPFTSKVANITCVPTVIKEGRCALVTSFSCFKFMALYSFIEFLSVLILYWIASNLGDFQYLYVDLILILSLAVVMGRTGPRKRLSVRRPPGSLLRKSFVVSLLVQITLQAGFQAGALLYAKSQPWFVPAPPALPDKTIYKCYENTIVFVVSIFQYLGVAVAFSQGKPFRAPMYTNLWYIAVLFVLLGCCAYILVYPDSDFTAKTLQLQMPPLDFRYKLIGIVLVNMLLSISIEHLILNNASVRSFFARFIPKRHYKNEYKDVSKEILVSGWVDAHARQPPALEPPQR